LTIDSIINWIAQNPEWSVAIIFLIAFLESLIILSLFVPGWLLLVGFGTLIGSGILDFNMMVIGSFLGAVIGEGVGFYLGWRYRDKISHWPWLQKNKKLLERSQHFFAKHGAASIAFGRFFGPVRAFIPLIAGISQMPPMRFYLINIFSALVWAPAYLMPGIVAGAAIKIDKDSAYSMIIFAIAFLILSWLMVKEIYALMTKKNNEKVAQFLSVPIPLIKAVISLSSLIVLLKIFFTSTLYPQFSGVWESVISIISH